MPELTLAQLASAISATLRGDGSATVSRCAPIEDAGPGDLTFVANQKYARLLKKTAATAAIVSPHNVTRAPDALPLLIADDPYFAFRQAVVVLHGHRQHPAPEIASTACIHPSAKIGRDCHVGPFAVVAAGATLGDRCVLYPHTVLGPNSTLGQDSVLFPHVTVYENCSIGARVIIHAGSVIGTDGFGFATHKGEHHKIPQVGNVVIEDDVEIGANCCVQRATIGTTRIGRGTKMSDLLDIGHGSTIGRHNLLVSQVGIAGSACTGDYVAIGGQSGVAGHLTVGKAAQVAARSGVATDIPPGVQYGGSPAIPLDEAKRVGMEVVRLPQIVQQLHDLSERLARLESSLAAKSC